MNKRAKTKLQQLIKAINEDKPPIEILREGGISEEGIREFAELKAELLLRRYTDEQK
jgi:hypothetical protein